MLILIDVDIALRQVQVDGCDVDLNPSKKNQLATLLKLFTAQQGHVRPKSLISKRAMDSIFNWNAMVQHVEDCNSRTPPGVASKDFTPFLK